MHSVIKSCCLLKGNGDETYVVWLWPNNARMRMKCITFRSMNHMYGRERKFSKSTLNYNAKFPLKCKYNKSRIKYEFSIASFSIISTIWFSMFSKTKKIFWKKNFVQFSKRTLTMPMRVQKIKKPKNQAMIRNPIHSFNENKNKKKANIVFSSA